MGLARKESKDAAFGFLVAGDYGIVREIRDRCG
jgi:hypothetical protein